MKVTHLISGLVLIAAVCSDRELVHAGAAETSPAVQPSTVFANAPPAALLDVAEEAKQVFDAARLSNWTVAAVALRAMNESAADLPANFSKPDLAARLQSRLWEVGDAVATRQRVQTMDFANGIMLLVANLSEEYQTPLPYALVLLDFYGRELELGIAGADQARLTRASADLKQTWNRFERNVLQRGAVDEARRFTDIVAQLDGAQAPADFVEPARAELAAVDRLKKTFKLLKGALLMTVGLGLPHFSDGGLSGALAGWARAFHVDPDGRHLGRAIQAIATLNGGRLEAVRAGMVVYAALFLTEGTGLLARRRWAEYFTIVVTSSFVPLEVFEFVRRPDSLRLAVLLANVAVVWYLLPFHRAAAQATGRAWSWR